MAWFDERMTIRRALGASTSQPRYIETIARRGYRFVVPVKLVESSGEGLGAGVDSESFASDPLLEMDRINCRTAYRSFGCRFYWRWLHGPKLSAEDTIVLADINNQTSDSIFDDALNTSGLISTKVEPC